MEANELRIGNLVQLYRKPEDKEMSVFKISAIDTTETTHYVTLSDGFVVNIDTGIVPIELTVEALYRIGFEDYMKSNGANTRYTMGDYIVGYDINYKERGFFLDRMGWNHTRIKEKIKYIHKLQNIWHSVTDTELNCTHVKPILN